MFTPSMRQTPLTADVPPRPAPNTRTVFSLSDEVAALIKWTDFGGAAVALKRSSKEFVLILNFSRVEFRRTQGARSLDGRGLRRKKLIVSRPEDLCRGRRIDWERRKIPLKPPASARPQAAARAAGSDSAPTNCS